MTIRHVAILMLGLALTLPRSASASLSDGVSFVRSRQDSAGLVDGSVRSTDWAMVGVSASNTNPATVGLPSLTDAIAANPVSASSATDLERRILALRAADRSAATEASQLVNLSSDHQIGRSDMLNDDVFGVLALRAAGTASTVVADSVSFIQSHQNSDGGFSSFVGGSSDVDSTGAAIAALRTGGGSAEAINHGFDYLASHQNSDGGFGVKAGSGSNVDSTSWALWAYHTAGRSNVTAQSWLTAQQQTNGSYGGAVSTAYTLVALSDRPLPIVGSFASAPPPSSVPPSPTLPPIPVTQPNLEPTAPGGPLPSDGRAVSASTSISVSGSEARTSANGSATAVMNSHGALAVSTSSASASVSFAPFMTPASAAQLIQGEQAVQPNVVQTPLTEPLVLPRPQSKVSERTRAESSAGDRLEQSSPPSNPQPLTSSAGRIDSQAVRIERTGSPVQPLVRQLILSLILIGLADLTLIALGFVLSFTFQPQSPRW